MRGRTMWEERRKKTHACRHGWEEESGSPGIALLELDSSPWTGEQAERSAYPSQPIIYCLFRSSCAIRKEIKWYVAGLGSDPDEGAAACWLDIYD